MNVKKIVLSALTALSITLTFSCKGLINQPLENNVQYGSLVISTDKSSRALDTTGFTSALIEIESSDFTAPITKTVSLTNGAANQVVVENIPAGCNRVVSVTAFENSKKTDYTIRSVTDISSKETNSVTVNWDSTRKGNVFYSLLKNSVKIHLLTSDEIRNITNSIPKVHPALIDHDSIAQDFVTSSLKDEISYHKKYGTVLVTGVNTAGSSYTLRLPDISSKVQTLTESVIMNDVYPGNWKFTVIGSDGTEKSIDIPVKSGKETKVTVTCPGASKPDTSKIKIHVPASLGYNYIYAWTSATSTLTSKWPGSQMTDNDGDGTLDFELSATSTNIIFNNNKAGSTPGNGQTNDMFISKGGEFEYIGGAAGTKDLTGSSFSSNFKDAQSGPTELTITLDEEPAGAKVTVTSSGKYTDKKTVTITASNCISSKYTIDGSNPKTSATAIDFTGEVSFSVGSKEDAEGTVHTVKVWGQDDESEVTAEATYEKTNIPEKPETPTRLGAYYRVTDTQFTIWTDKSTDVKVSVKKQGESTFTDYKCTAGYKVNGDYPDASHIYGAKVDGDCNQAEYQFYIGGVKVRDPYGKMVKFEDADAKTNLIKANYPESNCTVSSYAGSSINIVMDTDSITPTAGEWYARPALVNREQSVVYELHVGDFTCDSTWGGTEAYRGKFKGFVESGTTYTSGSKTVKTGLDHLVELGVTHVQIMPMYDYATKYNHTLDEYYNWGYDPVNYNVPEDRFATDPRNYEERIRDVKDMINILHKNGIRVIMDVVYNHTFDGEMFKNISSQYYTPTDRSGCGNSVNVSNGMVSRMVRDSLEYWLEEFNLDGFRFDLMGIYTCDAVGDWGTYLNSKYSDRTLLLYGEPYQADNSDTANRVYASAIPNLEYAGIGAFAHKYRETLKGGSDDGVKGYIFNATEKDGSETAANVEVGLKGSNGNSSDVWTRYFTKKSYQAVNYLAAHDNLCLYDKIVVSGVKDDGYAQSIVKFGHGIIVLSQGVGFIHGGDDFLRTKTGGKWSEFKIDTRTAKENSYMFGQEMNRIDWSRKAKYYDLFKYNKDLIGFKKSHSGFYNGSAQTSRNGMIITYKVRDNDGTSLTCVLNPGSNYTYSSSNQVFNKTGIVSASSSTCEGTGVTVFKD